MLEHVGHKERKHLELPTFLSPLLHRAMERLVTSSRCSVVGFVLVHPDEVTWQRATDEVPLHFNGSTDDVLIAEKRGTLGSIVVSLWESTAMEHP